MHYVYVLKSLKDNNFYIGCTGNITDRLNYHNAGKVFSTKNRRPLELIYQESYIDKYEAYKKERYYKTPKGKRELKVKIIQN